jgi:hypothetical protein
MDRRRRTNRTVDRFRGRGGLARHRPSCDENGDIQSVAGDEPTGGRDDHGERWITRIRGREQHAQRIALIEMGQPGDAVLLAKADFCNTLAQ